MGNSEKEELKSTNPIRVVLADDHTLVRAGIRALLERIRGVEVLAEAGDGQEALRLIKELHPDIILLDIAMPVLSGLDVLRETTANFPELRVIILTVHETEEYAMHALRNGAAGVPKSAASAELEVALKRVAHGERYLSPEISKHAVANQYSGGSVSSQLVELTPRQREVLKMIAKGHSTKDIARTLEISAKTVETHRAQLMERLQIFDVAGLVRFAIRTGLIKIDD